MPIVYVVDNDASVLDALDPMIRSAGWEPYLAASAEEFLAQPHRAQIIFIGSRADIPCALHYVERTQALQQRYESLSRREREVMNLVVSGRLNKQVGCALGISEITVKAHRGRMMRKMRAASLAELVTMASSILADRYLGVVASPGRV